MRLQISGVSVLFCANSAFVLRRHGWRGLGSKFMNRSLSRFSLENGILIVARSQVLEHISDGTQPDLVNFSATHV
jgi:hypothetical protein